MNGKSLGSLVAGLTVGSLLATMAQAQVVTIDPNNFGSGQVISAPGVTFETEAFVQDGTDSNGIPVYAPTFGSVYSYNASCTNGSFPCPVVGTNLFAPSPSGALPNTPNFGNGGFWGNSGPLLNCSQNCLLYGNFSGAIFLRVDFANPINFVDALGFSSGGDNTGITAFDSAGDIVGQAFNSVGTNPAWGYATVTTATSDISSVLIGGANSYRGINVIDYSALPAPEIDTATAASGLTLLLGGLLVLRGRRTARS
jgi:hypothetical protein